MYAVYKLTTDAQKIGFPDPCMVDGLTPNVWCICRHDVTNWVDNQAQGNDIMYVAQDVAADVVYEVHDGVWRNS